MLPSAGVYANPLLALFGFFSSAFQEIVCLQIP
jgi:hypothetical protein